MKAFLFSALFILFQNPFYQEEIKKYIEEGKNLLVIRNYEEAKERFNLAYIISKARKDRYYIGISSYYLGLSSFYLNEYREALRFFKVSEKNISFIEEVDIVSHLYYLEGILYEKKKWYQQAVSYYNKVINVLKEYEEKNKELLLRYGESLLKTADIYSLIFKSGKFLSESVSRYVEAGDIFYNFDIYDKAAYSFYRASLVAKMLGNKDFPNFLRKAFSASCKTEGGYKFLDIVSLLEKYYFESFKYRDLEKLLIKDITIRRLKGITFDKENPYLFLGKLFLILGEYKKAIHWYKEALVFFNTKKDFISINIDIFYLYVIVGAFDEAMKVIDKLLELNEIGSENVVDIFFPAYITKAHLILLKAILLLYKGSFLKANRLLDDALLENDKNEIDEYNIKYAKLLVRFYMGEYDYVVSQIGLMEKNLKKYPPLYLKYKNLLGWSYIYIGELDKALYSFREMQYYIYKIILPEEFKWQAFLGEAYVLYKKGSITLARLRLERALKSLLLSLEHKNISFFRMGFIYLDNKDTLMNTLIEILIKKMSWKK